MKHHYGIEYRQLVYWQSFGRDLGNKWGIHDARAILNRRLVWLLKADAPARNIGHIAIALHAIGGDIRDFTS